MYDKVKSTAAFLRGKIAGQPETAIILGTGLGGLVKHIDGAQAIDYGAIPDFPVSTVEGHSGRLIFGKLNGKRIVAMQGRFHYYEGYDMKQVTFPVRVFRELGVERLFVSNASGSLNPAFDIGDLMILTDHINLMPNPLHGANDERFGVRFPDMSQAYDRDLIALAESIGAENGIKLQKGIYVGTAGPTFETPAEYKYFRIIGGDAVGMSTVPEVIVARHGGLPVFGISIITDLGCEGKIREVSHAEVQEAGAKAEVVMTRLISEMLAKL
jgi:purine-nucleoside phosphorylase